jgi:hypothetical protein
VGRRSSEASSRAQSSERQRLALRRWVSWLWIVATSIQNAPENRCRASTSACERGAGGQARGHFATS